MDWSELARMVIARGAPVLGTALGGPLGGAAGQVLAEVLGANGATPSDIHDALRVPADPAVQTALAEAETRWVEMVRAEAEAARVAVERTHDSIAAELNAGDVIQRWWRPIYALELTAECAVLWASVIHGFWRADVTVFNALVAGTGLAIAYWGFRFAVLGIYVGGRTREKLSAGGRLAATSWGGLKKAS